MFRDADITLGGPEAVLSERGRIKFAVAKYTLGALFVVCSGLLVGGLAWAIRMESWAGASAVTQIEKRLHADGRSRLQLAGLREQILTAALQEVVRDKTSDSDRATRIANLRRLMDDQRREVREAREQRDHKTEGDFEALTVIRIGDKTFPVNNTRDGRMRPEMVEAFLRNDQALSSLLQAANRRALAQAPVNLDAIIQADLARKLENK